jgi:phosphate/sulfate permease
MTMHDLGILIPIIAVSIPVLIVLIVFYFSSKEKKYKYDALIEATKNIKDTEDVKGLLESFKKGKKSNTDYRKTGLVTMFTGVGLAFFGNYGLRNDVVMGVGLLVMFIGVGQMIAGYVYPNQPDEINNAVENFEKK